MSLTFFIESPTSIDHIEINELPGTDVLALLFPVSTSAIKSLAQTNQLSSLEQTSGVYSANQSRRRTQKLPISLLERSSQVEKYTLGTSENNDIILQHSSDKEKECWIFLSHYEFYLDPDHNVLVLYNISNI